jgi:K+-transporting ATPase KdpF subunit
MPECFAVRAQTREIHDAGCPHGGVHRRVFRGGVSLRQGLPEAEVVQMHMDWITWTGLILSVLLLVYLTVSLLFPEKF